LVALFKSNQMIGNILLVPYLLLLGLPILLSKASVLPDIQGGVLWQTLLPLIEGSKSMIVFGMLLLFLSGLLLNRIENKYKLSNELNLLPGMSFILLAAIVPNAMMANPVSLSLPFLILVIQELFGIYRTTKPEAKVFNIGFWFAISFLALPSLLIFIPFVIMAMVIIRAFSLREIFMLICGILTPLILIGIFYFWMDKFPVFLATTFYYGISWTDFSGSVSVLVIIPMALIGLMLSLCILFYSSFQVKKSIQVKKYIDILFWLMVFAGVGALFQAKVTFQYLLLLIPCISFALTFWLLKLGNQKAEMLHGILFLFILIWHFMT